MNFAFFDVDTQWGDPARQCLLLRAHLREMAATYDRVAGLVSSSGAPVVATLCLQSPAIDLTADADWLWVPQTGNPAAWQEKVAGYRRYILEKQACGTSAENVAARAFDVFHSHPHARALVEAIGVRHWYVFGRAEICVGSVVDGLRAMGCEVTLIGDAVAPGSRGTAETVSEFLDHSGVEVITVDDLVERLSA
jgi:hypothetical protein